MHDQVSVGKCVDISVCEHKSEYRLDKSVSSISQRKSISVCMQGGLTCVTDGGKNV